METRPEIRLERLDGRNESSLLAIKDVFSIGTIGDQDWILARSVNWTVNIGSNWETGAFEGYGDVLFEYQIMLVIDKSLLQVSNGIRHLAATFLLGPEV